MTSRRNFLKVGLGALPVICIGGTVPAFVAQMAFAGPSTQPSAVSNDNILVIVQLSGGNDGLNTVVPFSDDLYRKARPTLGLKNNLLKINERFALNPGMTAFKNLFDDGKLAIVNGCGYPKPNRSHFESMAIWHTGDPVNPGHDGGWLGHYLDHLKRGTAGNSMSAINIGSELPQALVSASAPVPSINSLEDFQIRVVGKSEKDTAADRAIVKQLIQTQSDDPQLQFLARQAAQAVISTEQIAKLNGGYKADVEYPQGLGQRLRLIAQLINGQFGTKVFYCDIGGFDTHANQMYGHEKQLKEVSDSIAAFMKDMNSKGYGDKVTVMCFSEFGRRVTQNDSNGTDHGAAGPMFLVGNKVKGGLHGDYPSLAKEKLNDGDLAFTTDFRRVYAAILKNWLNSDPASVLKQTFDPLAVL